MSINDLHEAERAIHATLHAQVGPISAGTLVDALMRRGFGEEATRVAMWKLIDRGEIILTPDRKLEVPVAPQTSPTA